jgi:hypothetical protein
MLVKYWFSITDDEQKLRFLASAGSSTPRPRRQCSNALPEAPWWVVEANDKKRARLNCIAHLLTRIPYQELPYEKPILPKRAHSPDYHRTPVPKEMYVPDHSANLTKVVSRPSAFPRRRRR